MDKWLMFKNYMHNELGITKEDIRQWVEDSVKEQAERMVQNEFSRFNTTEIVREVMRSKAIGSSVSLREEIIYKATSEFREAITKKLGK